MKNSDSSLIENNHYTMIILCGGFGTRLASISNGVPKSLIPIDDVVFLDFIFEKLIKHNINKVFLSLCYKPHLFLKYLENKRLPFDVIPIIEAEPLGTGGAIKNVFENVQGLQHAMVINGDTLNSMNYDHFFDFYKKSNYSAVIGISFVQNTARYGAVISDKSVVLKFEEKGIDGCGFINNGSYIFSREIFDNWRGSFSIENDVFSKLIEKGKLNCFKVENDRFIDIGIPKDYFKFIEMKKTENEI